MLTKLNDKEIEDVLNKQHIGRLGCHADGRTYIVPLNYIYRNGAIYAHSAPGMKIEMMRKNPMACFEVDEIKDTFRWRSVIAWGKFEEIVDPDKKQQAMQGLIHTLMPLTSLADEHPSHGISDHDPSEVIVFKIVLAEKTGRMENHEQYI